MLREFGKIGELIKEGGYAPQEREAQRLQRRGRKAWSVHNEILQS